MTAVASHVEGCIHDNNEMVGDLSLKLLTWPHTGKMKQVSSSFIFLNHTL